MREHFDAWTRASHRAVATCNDCHTPPGLIPKHVTKARNGFRVHDIQDRTFTLRNQAMDVLVALVGDLKAARTGGATDGKCRRRV